jgi:hypothetical protein
MKTKPHIQNYRDLIKNRNKTTGKFFVKATERLVSLSVAAFHGTDIKCG